MELILILEEVPPPQSIYPDKSNPHSAGCGGLVQGQHGGIIRSPGYPDGITVILVILY